MKLTLQNRTDHHAVMHFTWPDGRPGVCNVQARGERAIPIRDGSAAAVPFILDHLARFGVVAAEGADRYDAARGLNTPPWRGVVYKVEGSP